MNMTERLQLYRVSVERRLLTQLLNFEIFIRFIGCSKNHIKRDFFRKFPIVQAYQEIEVQKLGSG